MSRHTAPPAPKHYLGPGDSIGEGDTELVLNVLPQNLAETAFEKLREEVQWHVMHHRGGEVPRLVATEGEVLPDGSFPIYRHPSDRTPPLLPFSPTVALIRAHVEQVLKHPVNHVLIQHYRSGADYISEHSDKTIDIVRGSKIVNVSLGAQRVMTLRTKKDAMQKGTKDRVTQRVPLPHNSMFILGLETNAKWLHSIRHDNRPPTVKSTEEVYNDGERISLTFRHIGTFLSADERRIWGQGAKRKTHTEAGSVINGGADAEKLLDWFGQENHSSQFDWDACYGQGSNVYNLTTEVQDDQS